MALESTLAVASDGLLTPSLYFTLSAATRGYVLGSIVLEAPTPAPTPGGVLRASKRVKSVDTTLKDFEYTQRLQTEDDEILAVIIAAILKGLA